MNETNNVFLKLLVFIFLLTLLLGYILNVDWLHIVGISTGIYLIARSVFTRKPQITEDWQRAHIGKYVIKTDNFMLVVIALILLVIFLSQEQKEVNLTTYHILILVLLGLSFVRVKVEKRSTLENGD